MKLSRIAGIRTKMASNDFTSLLMQLCMQLILNFIAYISLTIALVVPFVKKNNNLHKK